MINESDFFVIEKKNERYSYLVRPIVTERPHYSYSREKKENENEKLLSDREISILT